MSVPSAGARAGQTGRIYFGLRVEIGKGVELAGWRE